ncbi:MULTISPECIES: BMP family ABC transporter substrate-binding protein [unclassified Pseudofrankia]|uniref:BMP family ABC transporter substrate-binding protein n=1 Tax=unclassified Pseudofrankia TaxID=2994372 RepID=UPI0008D8D705|nr:MULTISPECIES: BMP family ABC transporter substrate-binding protein [unclassified Pseudofrankia]MDT3440104.1 BMP family ABC transporter substrate-binding protein [Pseudofrankia sp. BMG5.37]OHV44716.1 BMP family ABC transporter substrate-binding protein [Pseudofrankia sp. BMG5.36]
MTVRSLRPRTAALAAGAAALSMLLVSACGDNSADTTTAAASGTPAAAKQPDVNGDGKVVIGILSPGDTNDNGYYESFVASAKTFADEKGWKVITQDKLNPADAATAARNMCRQNVDLVAVGASELKDAIPVAAEPVCAKSNWYVAAGQGVEQTQYISTSTDDANESLMAAGYAAGLLMKDKGATKAGYVTGPELDFSVVAYKAFKAGIRMVIPNADVVATYTGDFDDSAKGQEAALAQINQGVQMLYPYLGGATDAAAKVATEHGVPSLTPGTDRCGDPTADFAVSVIFSPGDYFTAALKAFSTGDLKMGQTRKWQMGKDAVPTVKICKGTDAQNKAVADFIAKVGSGEIVPADEVAKLAS